MGKLPPLQMKSPADSSTSAQIVIPDLIEMNSAQSLSEPCTLTSLLQSSLQSNLVLQRELRKCLAIVHQKKTANTVEASTLLQTLVRKDHLYARDPNKGRHKRPWSHLYFSDSDNSVPEPNNDTLRRRRWEGTDDLIALSRRWSKAELMLLKKTVLAVEKEQIEKSSHEHIFRDEDIDFNQVTLRMRQEMSKSSKTRQKDLQSPLYNDDVDEDIPKLRSVSDYKNKYLTSLSASLNNAPFTKAESIKILEMVHKEKGHPSWDKIALALNTNRSPFACFRHYQVKLNNNMSTSSMDESSSLSVLSNPSSWTSTEDELLLKFIAASGPQSFINQKFAADLAIRFFPRMTVKQVFGRMTSTLIIPTWKHERWSEKEERKLALCMRVYCNASSPIHEAAFHFPQRAANSVLVKWNRSLNPEFSTQPFTPQEDKALLDAVEEAGSAVNWKAISSKFPSRNPRSLFHRWTCLAPKEDILKRYEDAYIVRSVAKRGAVGHGDDEKLNPDEFVVGAWKRAND